MGFPSLVGLMLRHSDWVLRSHGLHSRLVELDNGATIHCWVPNNPDAPKMPLVLLHGFGSRGAPAWEWQVGELSKHFHLYIPDLLFFGGSNMAKRRGKGGTVKKGDGEDRKSNDDGEGNVDDDDDDEDDDDEGDGDCRSEVFQAHCIYETLSKCGAFRARAGEEEQGIMVCGHSYGGFVAYRLAHLYGPSQIRRLVLISSGIMMDPRSIDPLLRASGYGTIHQLLVPESPADLKICLTFVLNHLPPFIPNFIFKDMFQAFFGDRRQEKLELVDGIILGKEGSPPLPRIEQEVLIIWGEEDKIFSVELAHKLKSFLGDNAQLKTLKGVGHVPPFAKGIGLANMIVKFLKN